MPRPAALLPLLLLLLAPKVQAEPMAVDPARQTCTLQNTPDYRIVVSVPLEAVTFRDHAVLVQVQNFTTVQVLNGRLDLDAAAADTFITLARQATASCAGQQDGVPSAPDRNRT